MAKHMKIAELPSLEIHWLAHFALIAVALSVGVGVYHGVHVNATLHGPMAIIIPAAVAGVASVMIFALWHKLIRHGPMLSSWLPLGAIAIGALVALGAIYTTATFFVSAVVGESAVRNHMVNTLSEYETALNGAYTNFKSEEAILTKMNESSAQARAMVSAEAANGGCGPVCESLQRQATQFDSARRQGIQSQAEGDRVMEDAQIVIGDARAALAESMTAADQERLFANVQSTITGAIAELESNSVTNLSFNVGSVSNTGDMGNLTNGVRDVADRVGMERRDVTMPTYVTLTPYEAVTQDVGKYGLIWTFAVVIELFPLLFLITLSLLVANTRMVVSADQTNVAPLRREDAA
jgi:hypothetical protein